MFTIIKRQKHLILVYCILLSFTLILPEAQIEKAINKVTNDKLESGWTSSDKCSNYCSGHGSLFYDSKIPSKNVIYLFSHQILNYNHTTDKQ